MSGETNAAWSQARRILLVVLAIELSIEHNTEGQLHELNILPVPAKALMAL